MPQSHPQSQSERRLRRGIADACPSAGIVAAGREWLRGMFPATRPIRFRLHDRSQNFGDVFAFKCLFVRSSNSYSTQPNAQISVRLSTALPRACSGLMYAGVPRITPCIVAAMLSVGELEGSSSARVTGEGLRQAEVQYLHLAFRRHLHVGRFQVAVDDAFLVRRFQRLRNLLAIVSASSIGTAPAR